MYNMLHGMNPFYSCVLHVLGFYEPKKIERFRDCGIIYDLKTIWIYTRTGGENEAKYPNKILTKCPLFLNKLDDKYDDTYKIYKFLYPKTKKELEIIKNLEQIMPPSSPVDWQKFFDNFEENTKDNQAVKEFQSQLSELLNNID